MLVDGKSRVLKISIIVIKPALGIDAAPILAKVAVKLVKHSSTNDKSLPFNWAINITATASYNAVPFMFTVAPTLSSK